jgi:hypothetical protein
MARLSWFGLAALLLSFGADVSAQPAAAAPGVTEYEVGVYLVHWNDDQPRPWTTAQADQAAEAIAEKYRVLSRGQARLVFRPARPWGRATMFTSSQGRCPVYDLRAQVPAIWGEPPPPYLLFFSTPHRSCAGGKASAPDALVNGQLSASLGWHELGHSIFRWRDVKDTSTIMNGSGGNCCLTPYQLWTARGVHAAPGWLQEGQSMRTVRRSGTFTFVNIESDKGVRALRIPTPLSDGLNYWLALTGKGVQLWAPGGQVQQFECRWHLAPGQTHTIDLRVDCTRTPPVVIETLRTGGGKATARTVFPPDGP